MFPSLRCCTARAHTPLIKFLGKRSWPIHVDTPHPHPAAPADLKQTFLNNIQSSTSGPNVYNDFWEAPNRFWQSKVRQLSDAEMESIMSGGASSY